VAAQRNPGDGKNKKDLLSEVLDFGVDSQEEESPGLSDRIRKVKEKIDELNERIHRLTTRTE
jgi:TolA-binding protein